MKTKFRILTLLALMCGIGAMAQDVKNFKVDSVFYVITAPDAVRADHAHAGPSGEIVVPGEVSYGGTAYKVTSVGTKEYSNGFSFGTKNKLLSVSLPNTVEVIEKWAFADCKDLKSLDIPSSVKEIGFGAFWKCESLQELNIPSSVKTIGENAFWGCTALKSLVIPSSVVSIGINAFRNCSNMEELVIPNSVKELGSHFITGCDKLRTLTLPDKKPQLIGRYDKDIPNYYQVFYFAGKSLETIKGNSLPYPAYVVTEIMNNLDTYAGHSIHMSFETSYPEAKATSPWATKNLDRLRTSFSYFAQEEAYAQMEQWQKKKEYETTAQYRQRMSPENRQKKMNEIVDALKKRYITAAANIAGREIGAYDADYGTFPVTIGRVKTFAQVPAAEAPQFKEKFQKVDINPIYDIVNDQLVITACTFKLKGKTYQSTQAYEGGGNEADNSLAALPPLDFDFGGSAVDNGQGGDNNNGGNNNRPAPLAIDRSTDTNIPTSKLKSENTFAVIIGNENYQRVARVQYANNDAAVFAQYCQKTLGLPSQNIRSYKDATYGTMLAALKDIQTIADAYKGNIDVIFYYAGHGVPSESDQSAYLLPVDADGTQTDVCLSTKKLYQSLNDLHARQVVVLMDACFSGAKRGDGMLAAARGVALKVKDDVPTGNMVVFTAATGQQTAFPFKEKGHGMFTYYILKKLQDSKGDVSLGDLTDYVSQQVAQQSAVVNKRSQTPTVIPSLSVSSNWRQMKLE